MLLNISGGPDLGLLEVNEAAEIIHGVAHQDANIIFGAVIEDDMGDDVRVTVIAAGFDRWDDSASHRPAPVRRARPVEPDLTDGPSDPTGEVPIADVFAVDHHDDDEDEGIGLEFDDDDDFDVPDFLK